MSDKEDIIEPVNVGLDASAEKVVGIKEMPPEEIDKLPFAKWRGRIDLGGNELDCYVLSDETRVLSSGSTTKAIANVERGACRTT